MPSNTSHAGPYYVNAKTGPVRNNSATILYGGNADTTGFNPAVTQVLGATTVGYHSGTHGSAVPGPYTPTRYIPNRCTAKAVSSGKFASMTKGKYVMMRFCSELAGVANTVLQTGAADFGRLPYPARVSNRIRTQLFIMTGGWFYQTGQPVNRTESADVLAPEAFPTRAIPGKLTFAVSSQSITRTNYPERTSE